MNLTDSGNPVSQKISVIQRKLDSGKHESRRDELEAQISKLEAERLVIVGARKAIGSRREKLKSVPPRGISPGEHVRFLEMTQGGTFIP